jgi:hypothetical protein
MRSFYIRNADAAIEVKLTEKAVIGFQSRVQHGGFEAGKVGYSDDPTDPKSGVSGRDVEYGSVGVLLSAVLPRMASRIVLPLTTIQWTCPSVF